MPTSLESSRPIMAPSTRTSVRYSTYSMAPTVATVQTTDSNSSASAEIRDIEKGLDRMENKALSQQRVVLNEERTTNMQKLALGAKLERALDRRMHGQDAIMRKRGPSVSEKKKVQGKENVEAPLSEKA